jgi:hypothetical protein
MTVSAVRVIRLVLLVLVASAAASAQISPSGSLSGIVRDAQGLPVPGASVSLTGDAVPGGRDVITDESGHFRFPRLQPGNYRVTGRLQGMRDVAVDAVVALDRDTQVPITMSIGGVTETVTVTAAVPRVDARSTEVSVNFTREEFESRPLVRSYAGLIDLAPGIASNQAFSPRGEGTSYGVNAGASRQENTYLLDGINITNPAFGDLQQDLNELDIQEVNIKRGGISAEFGRTGGFVVNALTKSGGNRLAGQARLEFIADSFIADSKDPTLTTAFDRANPTIGAGGPLLRDHLWFYGSGNWIRRTETGRVNRIGDVPDEELDVDEYFAKLTTAPTKSHFGMASFRWRDQVRTNSGVLATYVPTVAENQARDDRLAVANWTWFARPDTNFDVRYTHNSDRNAIDPIVSIPFRQTPFDVARPDLMGQFTTAPGYIVGGARAAGDTAGAVMLGVNDQEYYRNEVKATMSWLTSAGRTAHDLRFGAGFDRGGENLTRAANGWGLITVATAAQAAANCGGRPCFRAAYVSPQDQESIGETWSIFAQDRMTLGARTTINAGVLFNRDTMIGNGTIELVTWDFLDQVQPRLGVSFVPDVSGNDKLYANYGRYYNNDNRSFARAAAPRRIFTSDAWIDAGTGAVLLDLPRASETGKIILPGLEPTFTDEFLAGYARPVGDWTAEVWGMYRRTDDFIEDFPDPQAPAGARNPSSRYVMGNLNGGPHDPADAYRSYKAITFEVARPMLNRWSLNASYGFSRLRGNWDIDYSLVTVFFASSILHDAEGLFIDDPLRDGILHGDRPHVFKVYGAIEPLPQLTVGAGLRSQSGSAYQAVTRDFYGGFRQYLEPAGSRRHPAWTNVDLQAAYHLPFADARKVVFEARFLNLFDDQAALTVDNRQHSTVDPALFGLPTLYAPPRRFLLTARVDF